MNSRPIKCLYITHWNISGSDYQHELQALLTPGITSFEFHGWGADILRSRTERIKCYLMQGLYCVRHWGKYEWIITNQQYIGLLICIFNHINPKKRRIVIAGLLINPNTSMINSLFSKIICKNSQYIISFSKEHTQILKSKYHDFQNKIRFMYLPNTPVNPKQIIEEKFIFAGGFSNRDFDTLISAFGNTRHSVTIVSPSVKSKYPNIKIITHANETEFYEIMMKHKYILVLLENMNLPNGQLLITKAMSAGKIVIATDCLGTKDYIANWINGVLVPHHDPTSLINAINAIEDDPLLEINMRNNAKTFFEDTLSWNGFWNHVQGLIQES